MTRLSVCILIPFNAGIDVSQHFFVQCFWLSAPGTQFCDVPGTASNAADDRQRILKKLFIDA